MKPLLERAPGLEQEKRDMLQRKRDDKAAEEIKECKFKPERVCAKSSDLYLKKLGRSAAVAPEDFFQYKRFQEMRNDQRRQILSEIESKELTFRPQINASSKEMSMKKRLNNSVEVCASSRHVQIAHAATTTTP